MLQGDTYARMLTAYDNRPEKETDRPNHRRFEKF